MNIETIEFLWKKSQNQVAFKKSSLRLPSFLFSSEILVRKRESWKKLLELQSVEGEERLVEESLVFLVQNYNPKIDTDLSIIFNQLSGLYSNLSLSYREYCLEILQKKSLKNSFLEQKTLIDIFILKLGFSSLIQHSSKSDYEVEKLSRFFKMHLSNDISEINFLIYSFKNVLKKDKMFPSLTSSSFSIEESNIKKHSEFMFYHMKYLSVHENYSEAILVAQKALNVPTHIESVYMCAKKLVKICFKVNLELPSFFWDYLTKCNTPCPKIVGRLVSSYVKSKLLLNRNKQKILNRTVFRLLCYHLGSKAVWNYFENFCLSEGWEGAINYRAFIVSCIEKIGIEITRKIISKNELLIYISVLFKVAEKLEKLKEKEIYFNKLEILKRKCFE